ncbi:MAG: hypothetical protein JWN98_128 [Abditibacteriota bacterium]|nr:hypothetical protein [Abditibacteriota bacterium]
METLPAVIVSHPRAYPRPRPLALSLYVYVALFMVFAWAANSAPISEKFVPIFVSALVGSTVAIFWVWSYSDGKTDDDSLRSLILIGVVLEVL